MRIDIHACLRLPGREQAFETFVKCERGGCGQVVKRENAVAFLAHYRLAGEEQYGPIFFCSSTCYLLSATENDGGRA